MVWGASNRPSQHIGKRVVDLEPNKRPRNEDIRVENHLKRMRKWNGHLAYTAADRSCNVAA